MGIMKRTLELLFPRGYLWRFIGDSAKLIEALAMSLDRAKEAIDQMRAESIPRTALHTIPEWYQTLGIQYDDTLPLEKHRTILSAMATAESTCLRGGLEVQLAKEYSGLTLTEDSGTGYSITGIVPTENDALRVGAILARLAPLHLVPTVFGYTAATAGNPNPVPPSPGEAGGSILNMTDIPICGVATCGVTTCGVSA